MAATSCPRRRHWSVGLAVPDHRRWRDGGRGMGRLCHLQHRKLRTGSSYQPRQTSMEALAGRPAHEHARGWRRPCLRLVSRWPRRPPALPGCLRCPFGSGIMTKPHRCGGHHRADPSRWTSLPDQSRGHAVLLPPGTLVLRTSKNATSSPMVWHRECYFSQRREQTGEAGSKAETYQTEHVAARGVDPDGLTLFLRNRPAR